MTQSRATGHVDGNRDVAEALRRAHFLGSIAASFNSEDLVALGNDAHSLQAIQQELLVAHVTEHETGPI